MAKLETVYFLLSQSQLRGLLVSMALDVKKYEREYMPEAAIELAIIDALAGVSGLQLPSPKKHISLWDKIRYWFYTKRVWKSGMAAKNIEDWRNDNEKRRTM